MVLQPVVQVERGEQSQVSILFEVKWFYNVEPRLPIGVEQRVSILFEVKWFYNCANRF